MTAPRFATPEQTRQYFEKHPLSTPPLALGRTGWTVSTVGFGGYRIHERDADHEKALRKALTSGCNLIDTSTNYTNGSSERLIGKVLGGLFAEKLLAREEVVVVSKAGYVQGDNLELAQKRLREENPFPEMVQYAPEIWHCISPEFLEDQISRSLERLNLETLDVLLLHNPEYFLKADGNHAEYYQRIRKAFAYLETEVKRGRIQYYGISSNTFPEAKESPDYTSLETVLEIAEELSPDHHFAVIQFPFNLFEPGAVFESNNTGKSVCQLAVEKNLGTLINRPLNAFAGNRMLRLAEFPSHHGIDVDSLVQDAFQRAIDLESRYPAAELIPASQVAWAHIIHHNLSKLTELENWKDLLTYRINPTLTEALNELNRHPEYQDWTAEYQKAASVLFAAFTAHLEAQSAVRSRLLAVSMDQVATELKTSKTLSQKAIRVYRSLPGIHCVLVGMRKPDYVEDALTLAAPISAESAVDAIEAAHAEYEKGTST